MPKNANLELLERCVKCSKCGFKTTYGEYLGCDFEGCPNCGGLGNFYLTKEKGND